MGEEPPVERIDERSEEVQEAPWKSLVLEASKLGMKATSSIGVEPMRPCHVGELVDAEGHRALEVSGRGLMLSESNSFLGRNSSTRIWILPETGETLQREVVETGKRERYKTNRYTEKGVFTLRVNPTAEERGSRPELWTERSETFYPLSRPPKGQPIIEPGALVYLVAASGVEKPGDQELLYAFSDKRVVPVEAKGVRWTTTAVVFDLIEGEQTHRVEELDYRVLEVSLRALPEAGSDSNLELLGLHGDVTMLLDPEHRMPVEISGRVKFLGGLTIRLQRAAVN